MKPPSARTVLRPSSRPSASSSGLPEAPRGSGAVCSIARCGCGGDVAVGDAQPAAAGVGKGVHEVAEALPAGGSGEREGGDVARVGLEGGHVDLRVGAAEPTGVGRRSANATPTSSPRST